MVNQLRSVVIIIPYWLQETKKTHFYGREASVMSRIANLKSEESIKSVFFSIFPFAFCFRG